MFITNNREKELTLGERIKNLISASEELKFLVGFFYFSGWTELYEAIRERIERYPDLKIKILVGLKVDVINGRIIEVGTQEDKSKSNKEIREEFINSLKKALNTEEFDTEEFYNQAKFFIKLSKEGKLQIRKTRESNHAKLYCFKLKEISRPALFITGSSNLTKAGLVKQQEFNVEISDYGVDEAEKYFDKLWEEAIKITEDHIVKEKLLTTLEKETSIRRITPFEAYALALKSYLDTYKAQAQDKVEKVLKGAGFYPYKYQMDAISQALKILEDHNGVILADVVGLGKTVIACAIANLLGKRGVIVCPPGLMGDPTIENSGWKYYLEKFELYGWEIESIGKLEGLLNRIKDRNIEVVIVDEAHRFRNENTKRYEYLKEICRNKIVILLTATPFNNHPNDILSLLKLFTTPKKSSILMGENIQAKFKDFAGEFNELAYIKKYYKNSQKEEEVKKRYKRLFNEEFSEENLEKVDRRIKRIAKEIREIIEPVVIRRNRLDLKKNPDYEEEIKQLPKVNDPEAIFFELTQDQSRFYDYVIECFRDPEEGGRFTGAVYRPYYYRKGQEGDNFEAESQTNLFNFMRRLLVKRFESSFGAFRQSLENFKEFMEKTRDFIQKHNMYIMNRSILEDLYEKDPEDIEQELSKLLDDKEKAKNVYKYVLDKSFKKDDFIKDIEKDVKLFANLIERLEDLRLAQDDPKLGKLVEKLRELLKDPQRKVIIFSEYLDTVKYLKEKLECFFPGDVLAVDKNLDERLLGEIYQYFNANAQKEINQQDKYRILLGTDRISEGFNLNRADTIINYDIPWNPVRLIQRLGRISRIGKTLFSELYLYNFFPTEKGADITKQKEIAAQKISLIHNVLGEDSKILEPDEEPQPSKLYLKINKNPEELEEESFYTKVLIEFERIQKEHKDLIRELENFPKMVKVARKSSQDELLVIIKSGGLFVYRANMDSNEPKAERIYFEDIFERIKASPEEKPIDLSLNFWKMYYKVREELRKDKDINSLERSSETLINKLKEIIRDKEGRFPDRVKRFAEVMGEDIKYYGTFSAYTLRNLSKMDLEDLVRELEDLLQRLGEDYLEVQKQKLKNLQKEIILCIENRT